MAMAKRSQSNPWMTVAAIFIAVSLIAIVAAIVIYLNYEEQSKTLQDLQAQQEDLIKDSKIAALPRLIGEKASRDTYMDVSLGYIDKLVVKVLGSPGEDTSAQAKFATVNSKIKNFMQSFGENYPQLAAIDVNTIGLVGTMGRMKTKLDYLRDMKNDLQAKLNQEQNLRKQNEKSTQETITKLEEEKNQAAQQAADVQKSYNELKDFMDKSTEEQVQNLRKDIENMTAKADSLNDDLLKTQAELKVASTLLKDAREQLAVFTGKPDIEPMIREQDGKIVLIDEHAKIVHINLGRKDNVYPGLTFGVYEKTAPIPSDGKGKAEIEVFNVAERISTARILNSKIRNPILLEDKVANLVWSKEKKNLFVVTGDFDLDFDGAKDYQAKDKISHLIRNWGGDIEKTVSANTSFVVLGDPTRVLARPTYDDISVDPLAMEKYEASIKELKDYQEIIKQAQMLDIPILNYERFLYLIGYKSQSLRAGAFQK